MKYCESIYRTKRRRCREVLVGNIGVGGDNPVRIQSMTTTPTSDAPATAEQIIKLYEAGCEIARVTVQGKREADACGEIVNILAKKGIPIPIVADIHFYPPAAMRVVDFVDKVRINPGNFVDKRASFKVIEYDEAGYEKELAKIEEKFAPLVLKCKALKRAMRIGTNHGSLSDRIMNRYGDTPQGMVESALEFAAICRKYDYHDLIFSMKSSNTHVMIEAYRLLSAKMYELGWDYPLHLGVTEAGEGEDGRIKSAIGIGSLLLDGLGDTIRVSLTEDPWHEIDPCKRLLALAARCQMSEGIPPFKESFRTVERGGRRAVAFPKALSMHRDGTVYLAIGKEELKSPALFEGIGCKVELGRPSLGRGSVDGLLLTGGSGGEGASGALKKIEGIGITVLSSLPSSEFKTLLTIEEASNELEVKKRTERFRISPKGREGEPLALKIQEENIEMWEKIPAIAPSLIFLAPKNNRLHSCRKFFDWLQEKKLSIPVILNFSYGCSEEELMITAAAECGALLTDNLGEGICLEADIPPERKRAISFAILQGSRMRSVKTEFISCPSCGRTLFDLQEVTRRIKSRTDHLPGVKIAVMGCIVNGPGEMADAHFGYVGSKPGMIDLYVGKERVERDIPFGEAEDRLVDLIRAHGRWVEPHAGV